MKLKYLAALLTLALATPSFAAEPVTLRLGYGVASRADLHTKFLKPWADKVAADSQGTLKIDVFPDGTLTTDGQTFDRVIQGVSDVGWDLPLIYGARFQSLGVLGLPFMYDDAETAGAAM